VVLARREHVVMLEPFDRGLLATTLRYPYEVREQAPYFADIPEFKLPAEMKDLAAHIVDSKAIHFDPSQFIDHYETALVELLRAKQEGRVMEPPEEPAPHRVINLMDALRASIGTETKKKPAAASTRRRGAAKRKMRS
jgi:DNA end-binding protein Ku